MILTIKFARAIIIQKYDNRYQIEDKMSKYKTKQRDEILRLFMDNEGKCMSAREVCSVVTAGEATVFRALSSLTEEGLLKRFNGDSGRG